MSRICQLTGKIPQSGNNVSHAKNRTRRKFLPNLCNVSFYSETLDKKIKLRICAGAIRSVDKKGGFEEYLLSTKKDGMYPSVAKLKLELEKAKMVSK